MTASNEHVAAVTEEAYVYAFPMLMGYRAAFATFLVPSLPSYRGPLNAIHGEAVTLDHSFRDVITPNADTPYSMAGVDLRAEPVVLGVPAVPDRYYVMQLEDLYGTNAHYVGSRSTGSEAGTYLLVGPRYDGPDPEGFTDVLRFETDLVIVIGRTQLHGAADVEAISRVMRQYSLRPLSAHREEAPPAPIPFDWPVWDDGASRDERFVHFVNALLPLCQPPHPSESELMDRFASVGIGAGLPFDEATLPDEVRRAMRSGVDRARKRIAERAEGIGVPVNGWSAPDAFGDRGFFAGDHLLRAAGAMAGWGGNDTVEASYPICREDGEGEPLTGERRYRIHLSEPPPARAFWSVTMYDTSYDGVAGYLVENPIGRYLVNSTTPGLVRADDGSLTVHVQRDEPDTAEGRANWLPAPAGTFYLVLRIYWPRPEALDGTWAPPPVERC